MSLAQLRTTKLYQRVSRHQTIHQFVKYALIGGANVVLHLGIFNVLTALGMHTLAANAIGFFIGSVNSFVWNKLWAFRDARRDVVFRQYLTFLFFTVVGLALHTAAFRGWLAVFGHHGRLGENAALLLALPVSVVWNFTTYRLWTFKPGATSSAAGAGSLRSSER